MVALNRSTLQWVYWRTSNGRISCWAAFVLGASELIDLGPLDDWPEGDQLSNGLWDASFEGNVKPETSRIAAALAEG